MVEIVEHYSSSYAPRTYHNAKVADLTLALAVDFTTAGEKCTAKAAGEKIIKFAVRDSDILGCSRLLYSRIRRDNVKVLNIAGNGIYTLSKHGWTQQRINQYVYDLLKPVHDNWYFEKIVCGGQTGVDIAGAVSGKALGIHTTITMPKGLKQRFEDRVDVCMTNEQIFEQIDKGVNNLVLTVS